MKKDAQKKKVERIDVGKKSFVFVYVRFT